MNNESIDKYFHENGRLLPGYRIVGVVLILRHGDRSPMYTLPNHAGPPLSCNFQPQTPTHPPTSDTDNEDDDEDDQEDGADDYDREELEDDSYLEPSRRFVAAMESVALDNSSVSSRLFRRFGLFPNSSTCYGAQLTAAGAIQMFWLGRFLRSRYPTVAGIAQSQSNPDDDDDDDGQQFVNPTLVKSPRILVHSTDYPRTFQSAAALVFGFAGRVALTTAQFETTRNIYFCSESAGGNATCSCPVAGRMLAALKKNKTYDVDERKVRDEIARVFNVTNARLPWLSAMMEVFMAYACHHLPLPCGPKQKHCITWHIVNRMWKLSDNDDQSQQVRRLRHSTSSSTESPGADLLTLSSKLLAYPLLNKISRHFADLSWYQTRETAVNFVVYSGHDKTVATVARALGVFDGRWPPYGSRLVIELIASSSVHRPRHFIRVFYNGLDVTARMAFCRRSKTQGALCPLENYMYRFAFDGDHMKRRTEACRNM